MAEDQVDDEDCLSFKIQTKCSSLPKFFQIEQVQNDILFPDLCRDISECKCKIDIGERSKHWDKAKRRTNPYELVHIIGTNYLHTELLTSIKGLEMFSPLSRAFFKMLEIYDTFDIIPNEFKMKPGMIAHLAEGPGGFMEAVFKRRKEFGLSDNHYAITLYPKNRNIPGWSQLYRRKNHVLHHPNVHLLTGDLYKTSTIIAFAKNFTKERAFLVTCDGGFDYSKDFNNQERNSWRIIFSEIVTGLLIQKKGGTLICKMFDLFTHLSLQIIYILTKLYKEVYIAKPRTSRPANSEKYLVAKGFQGVSKNLISSMLGIIQRWDDITSITHQESGLARKVRWSKILIKNLAMTKEFLQEIRTINDTLTDKQKEHIDLTLRHIEGRVNQKWKETQSRLAMGWFRRYRVHTKEEMRSLQI